VQVSGNLKFEVKPPPQTAIAARIAAAIVREQVAPVIVAGSTLEGEESMLLDLFRQVVARDSAALLVPAPRHPERFDAVANLLESSPTPFHRRSQWDDAAPLVGSIFLLDTIGELASLYEFADLAFIGGSLVPRGGHNVLEAAQFGKAILVGPSTENFRDIVETFHRADALRVVTPQSLIPAVLHLLESDGERAALGRRALDVMRSQRGATERTVCALLALISAHAPAAALTSREPA
jgi:3-deoxy-D-manno-octulosonic-acid transferase